ncbi:Glucose-methanol-choline oxidoreductase family protein [Perilla frutescens var. hirtella]|uniref:Glucose-methanol-choline oxidoreductase family protein n=1 Tax=Perilla frutescens var. hirtella TaxID=608512 RepID=A0AAD4ITD1_PERFH|nr:Glucose-methanol-choline oxidoreductase family protein [Perilla frutescens var. hirtella]
MAERFFTLPPSYCIILAIATLISLPLSHSQQSPAYLGFVSNATEFPTEDYFDYIIVGGGTAGCPLAATLSEGYRVLVLERGGVPFGEANLMSRDGFLRTLMEVDAYESPAQAFTSEDGVPNARGRVLGGSSGINAGFYSRADPDFYRKSGIDWDLRVVNQSYEWVEKEIVFRPELRNWQSAVRDGLLEAGIDPYHGFSLDHVVGAKIGGSTFDSTGTRHSAADLLSDANPHNIKVVVKASVERVLMDSNAAAGGKRTATGVVFRDEEGGFHHAMVRDKGEVLLCAGALGSPQLLLLSGVGPRHYLASWGIPVALHSPYVGRFMYDNPRNGISIVPPVPLDHSLIQVVGITNSGTYIEAASNIVPFLSPARPVFIRPSLSSTYVTVATLMEKIVGPRSAGYLRLGSTDVRANPIVRFNYFSNPTDLELCINGTRRIADVLNTRAMDEFKVHQWFGGREFRYVGAAMPRDQWNDGEMGEFCRRTVSTIWHYHGGCLMGKVVDTNLRVVGVDGLRVVDGSTFTVSPGTNPQATLLMMGRHFGIKMLRERT